ncbi:MAG: hypothetical protein JWQ04_654 [Pedosphaera sp.]|nr:hypothetical protein [Pedosphaera sp.]
MNAEVYFIECVKPNGENVLTVPIALGGGMPLGMPKAITKREEGEAMWDGLMKVIQAHGIILPPFAIFRLVKFSRAEEMREWTAPVKETALSA